MNANYERILSNLKPTPQEQQIIQGVKQGILSDQNKSPFDDDKWYKTFTRNNKDGLDLAKAPKNTLLMVVSESVGTLYSNNRGTQIMRGSVIVKLEDNLVVCLDAYSWGLTSGSGTVVYNNNGYFSIDSTQLRGLVKSIATVNV